MSTNKPKVLVIVGPTGSGKTSLSINLAKHFNGEVISADSRQVYKGLDIGTEKITFGEMRGISHHMIDIVDVSTVYTAAEFASAGQIAITKITERKHLPIIAGGTFFYIDALLGTMKAPEVPPNPELRSKLENLSNEELLSKLTALDPVRAKNIDAQNPRRLTRAIEIASTLGHVPPLKETETYYDVLTLGIVVDKEVLRARLRARAISALNRGLIEETKNLIESGIERSRLMEIGLEYKLVIEHLEGLYSYEELIQKLEEKNWQYAKRQSMWLKRNKDIIWINPGETENAIASVSKWIST